MFEELTNVCIFRHARVDYNSLDPFIRLRESNRCDNVHQKMKTRVSPWIIGVETSHYLLLLLRFRPNISTSINRGEKNVGHTYLHLMDRM